MTQTVSVSCKLQVPVGLRLEIDRTSEGLADASNQILEVAKRENCRNATKLHQLTYYYELCIGGSTFSPVFNF